MVDIEQGGIVKPWSVPGSVDTLNANIIRAVRGVCMGALRRKRDQWNFKLCETRLVDEAGALAERAERDLGLRQGAIKHWPDEPGAGTKTERDTLEKAMVIFSRRRK